MGAKWSGLVVTYTRSPEVGHDCPPTPSPKKEGEPAYIILHAYCNFVESTAFSLPRGVNLYFDEIWGLF